MELDNSESESSDSEFLTKKVKTEKKNNQLLVRRAVTYKIQTVIFRYVQIP